LSTICGQGYELFIRVQLHKGPIWICSSLAYIYNNRVEEYVLAYYIKELMTVVKAGHCVSQLWDFLFISYCCCRQNAWVFLPKIFSSWYKAYELLFGISTPLYWPVTLDQWKVVRGRPLSCFDEKVMTFAGDKHCFNLMCQCKFKQSAWW